MIELRKDRKIVSQQRGSIRQTTLSKVMPSLDKSEMTMAIKMYARKITQSTEDLIFCRIKLKMLFNRVLNYGR